MLPSRWLIVHVAMHGGQPKQPKVTWTVQAFSLPRAMRGSLGFHHGGERDEDKAMRKRQETRQPGQGQGEGKRPVLSGSLYWQAGWLETGNGGLAGLDLDHQTAGWCHN